MSDSAFEASAFERTLGRRGPAHGWGWRRRALMFAVLLGCLGVFSLARWLAATPVIAALWTAGPQGALVLQGSTDPALHARRGHGVTAIVAPAGGELAVDALLLQRSPRWQVADGARQRQTSQQQGLAALLNMARPLGHVALRLDDGSSAQASVAERGYSGLGLLFWPLSGLALLLYLYAAVLLLARAPSGSLLFVAICLLQAVNLLLIAVETMPGLALSASVLPNEVALRVLLDLCTGAAIVQAFALHPQPLTRARAIAAAAWSVAPLWLLLAQIDAVGGLWWWAQGGCVVLGLAALAVISRSHRLQPNPYALVMRRFAAAALAALLLATAVVAMAARVPRIAADVAAVASLALTLLFALLLLLTPFLARSRQVLREFAMLAGVSTLATSLDLLFVAVFSLGPFTSLAIAVFIALGVYAGARQWLLDHLLGSGMPTIERTFDQIYRAAREVQARPSRYPQLLVQLLQELFEPLQLLRVERVPVRSRVIGGGSALVVPMRGADDEPLPATPGAVALVLRFAQRGQRLFTLDDARLADRVVDQLRRAVAYDQAVERGRFEERQRIAQDLHDDIGARLLTLMYQAPTPEMEDYIRHTLQDLKTLTRGLAAAEHPLSHAAAEWKADLTQRLSAADVALGWSFSSDLDLRLSMTQWSALTRVLRELVSNALYHGHAARIDVNFTLEGELLVLQVADDGRGRAPLTWAHGLGMGGVRKRVKLLGGEVAWRENEPRGIVCAVRVTDFSGRS